MSSSAALTAYFAYEDTGNIITTQQPDGNRVATVFGNCADSLPSSAGVPGGTATFGYDCATGLLTSAAGPNGHTTSYGYDAFGRLTSVADPDGGGQTIAYNSPTNIETETAISTAMEETRYSLADGYGRAIFDQIEDGAACDTVATEYDNMGRVSAVSLPYPSACGSTSTTGAEFTTTNYDGLGRPLTVSNAASAKTQYQYDAGAVAITGPSPNGVQRILQENGFGELWKVCGVTTLQGSAACGEPIAGNGFLTAYGYNTLGELSTVTQGAQTRTFAYDELGRLTSETTPESGATTFIYGSDSACGGASYPGSLAGKQDAMGNITCYARDAWGRVTGITYPTGPYASVTPARTFIYDSATVDGQAMTNTVGRLAEAYTGASGAKITDEGFGYDAMGRPTEFFESTPNSGGYYATQESYWLDGQEDTLQLPWTPLITYTPNARGEIISVTASSGQNPASAVKYNTAGQVTAITFGSGDGDGYQYDPETGRMSQYQFTVNGQTDTGNLTWNKDGTLAALDIADNISGSGDTENCTYAHDDLGRLSGVNCGSLWQQTFSLDAFGNLAKSGSLNWAANYPSGNHASLDAYDSDGNVTSDGTNTYAWDAAGQMIALNTNQATYDALGRLAQESANNNLRFYYSPDGALAGRDNACCGIRDQFVWLPGGGMADYDCCSVYYYEHPGWLGSWRLASDASRNLFSAQALAPFAATYAHTGPALSESFTGQDFPLTLNAGGAWVFTFPFRQYSPTQGRWLSPDPAGLAAVNPANPQAWNEYAYVGNQPLSATDPLGLNGVPWSRTGFWTQACANCPPPSPWNELSPSYWWFEFGIFGAAEIEPVLGGGGTGPAPIRTGTAAIKGPVCVSAGQINSFLAGSPLAGQGQNFYAAGQKYDVNPALPVAIADAESSLGRNTNATWGYYNAWGWGSTPALHAYARGWTTWEQGIFHVTWQLSNRKYLGAAAPLSTASAIYGKWCTTGNCADGLATINAVLSHFGVSPSSLRFQACQGKNP